MSTILWKPKNTEDTHLSKFIDQINSKYNLDLKTYNDLHNWSVKNISEFWDTTLQYTDIIYSGEYDTVVDELNIKPGIKWFEGLSLNFAENLLLYKDDRPAIISKFENHPSIINFLRKLKNWPFLLKN